MNAFPRQLTLVHPPSDWVVRHAPLIPKTGPVLDLACGGGRHARFLAACGHRVVAVDIDCRGVRDLAQRPDCFVVRADLERDIAWPLACGAWAGIVVTRYLHRPHFHRLFALLAPGGVLIYETFMTGQERLGRPSDPAFLLAPGELRSRCAPHLEIVAAEEGEIPNPFPIFLQRITARRRDLPNCGH